MGFLVLRSAAAEGGAEDPGDGAPTPESTGGDIWFDSRAGGAQSFQTATTHAQILSCYSDFSSFTRFTHATGFFEPDVDGNGTVARAIQWQDIQSPDEDQEAMVDTEQGSVVPNSASRGWYFSIKTRLGKRSGGAGTGTVDQWTLNPDNVNAHQKILLWNRTNRLYCVIRPDSTRISIDEDPGYNSTNFSENPYDYPGDVQTLTFYFKPETSDSANDGIVRAWRNGTQVLNVTNENIGTAGWEDWQETVTTHPAQAQVQYIWDVVAWVPPS